MSKQELEQRVQELERRVAELEARLANGAQTRDWLSTFGMFRGDKLAKRVNEAILAARERERREARRRASRARKSSSARAKA
jgi:hypothetical protein